VLFDDLARIESIGKRLPVLVRQVLIDLERVRRKAEHERDEYRDSVRALLAASRLQSGGIPSDGPLAAAYARGVALVGEEGS